MQCLLGDRITFFTIIFLNVYRSSATDVFRVLEQSIELTEIDVLDS